MVVWNAHGVGFFATLLLIFLQLFAAGTLARPQQLNSVSTTGLLVGKGSEVREAHYPPVLPEPVLAPLSHSSPISPSELNFSKKRRRRHAHFGSQQK